MILRVMVIMCATVAACAPADRITDRRAMVLEGDWRLELHDESSPQGSPSTGRMALVAVRHAVGPIRADDQSLAAGAVSMDAGALEQRVADGTRVAVEGAGADSVTIRFSGTHGEFSVVLSGVLRGDTVSGEWRSVLSRSQGSGGRFRMTRRR